MRLPTLVALAFCMAAPWWATAAPAASPGGAPRKARAVARPAPPPAAPDTTVADVAPAREAWTRAKALADQSRHDDALRALREALARSPDDTDLLWLEAAVTGWSGRHRESVTKFEALVSRHPELAAGTRADLAAQRLWSGDPQGAIRDLDQRLREEPGDHDARVLWALALSHADRLVESLAAYDALLADAPGDVDLSLQRARVLGWMGRHAEAVAAYRAVLERAPNHREALEGVARNENLRGEHRRAAELYERLIATPESGEPEGSRGDGELLKGAAYAYYWSGEADRSRAWLDRFLAGRPDDREGNELLTMLRREESPTLSVGFERADDTDALRVRSTLVDYRHPFGGRSAFLLLWRRDDVEDPAGNRTPWRAGAGLEHRWSARWSGRAVGTFWKPADDEKGVGLGMAALTWRPSDRMRLDAELARDVVLTREALAANIRMTTTSVGVAWQAQGHLVLRAAAGISQVSDANRLARLSAGGRLRALTSARAEIGVSATIEHLQARRDLDHGYYDPTRYLEFGPGLDVEVRLPGVTLGAEGRIGLQREDGADHEPFHAVRAFAEVPLGHALRLRAEGGRSDSNLSSASGFRQDRWAVGLTAGF